MGECFCFSVKFFIRSSIVSSAWDVKSQKFVPGQVRTLGNCQGRCFQLFLQTERKIVMMGMLASAEVPESERKLSV